MPPRDFIDSDGEPPRRKPGRPRKHGTPEWGWRMRGLDDRVEKQLDKALTPQQRRFAAEVLLDFDPIKAAERAGVSTPLLGLSWMGNRLVLGEIERNRRSVTSPEGRMFMFRRIVETVIDYVQQMLDVDRKEIIQLRIVNCRYCWGTNNEYQYTCAELDEVLEKHRNTQNPGIFNPKGGDGFDAMGNPNPDCPNCHGRGAKEPAVYFADWRYASKMAKDSVSSIKYSDKGGFEIKFHDKSRLVAIVMQSLSEMAKQFKLPEFGDPRTMTTDQLKDAVVSLSPSLDSDDPELVKYLGAYLPPKQSS